MREGAQVGRGAGRTVAQAGVVGGDLGDFGGAGGKGRLQAGSIGERTFPLGAGLSPTRGLTAKRQPDAVERVDATNTPPAAMSTDMFGVPDFSDTARWPDAATPEPSGEISEPRSAR